MSEAPRSASEADHKPAYYPVVVVPEGKGVEAVEWYKGALKAEEIAVYKNKDGTVMHGMLKSAFGFPIGIDEVTPKECNVEPVEGISKSGTGMHMYINIQGSYKADDAVKAMKAAGAHVTHEVRDLFYGHRVGRVVDKYGVSWSFANDFDVGEMKMPDKWGH